MLERYIINTACVCVFVFRYIVVWGFYVGVSENWKCLMTTNLILLFLSFLILIAYFVMNYGFCWLDAGKFNELVYNYPIRIPERFSLVIRSLLTQEGICFTLQRDFKFLEVRAELFLFPRTFSWDHIFWIDKVRHVEIFSRNPFNPWFTIRNLMSWMDCLVISILWYDTLYFPTLLLTLFNQIGCLSICGKAPPNRSKPSSAWTPHTSKFKAVYYVYNVLWMCVLNFKAHLGMLKCLPFSTTGSEWNDQIFFIIIIYIF